MSDAPPEERPDDDAADDDAMTIREAALADGRYVLFFTFGDDV